MAFDPEYHHRRSIRLQGYDYRQGGVYFVTICTHNRQCLLGEVSEVEMQLSEAGRIATATWDWLAAQYPYVSLDASIVMPNHLHGIIVVRDDAEEGPQEGGSRTAPTKKSLGRLVAAFKTVSSKAVNALPEPVGPPLWQRNYYEQIVRSTEELHRIRAYIKANPTHWPGDPENPGQPPANRPAPSW
jgi:REP element-mobilizing transposase RayT